MQDLGIPLFGFGLSDYRSLLAIQSTVKETRSKKGTSDKASNFSDFISLIIYNNWRTQ
jgi:hypothetical protein